ncbi:hypothetical protein Trydic_g17008 [Trypoxylus dichotomus]
MYRRATDPVRNTNVTVMKTITRILISDRVLVGRVARGIEPSSSNESTITYGVIVDHNIGTVKCFIVRCTNAKGLALYGDCIMIFRWLSYRRCTLSRIFKESQ